MTHHLRLYRVLPDSIKFGYRYCSTSAWIHHQALIPIVVPPGTWSEAQGINWANRWLKDHRVGGLFSNWQLVPCYYFHVAALWVGPEFSDARKSWTKSSVVATLIDDLFDTDGTQEEFLNFDASSISRFPENLQRNLDGKLADWCAILGDRSADHKVPILYNAERYAKSLDRSASLMLDSHLKEARSLYLKGLIELRTAESKNPQSYALCPSHGGKKDEEDEDGVSHSDGAISIEEAEIQVRRMIESSRRELLRMLVTEPSGTRKTLIELFFYTNQASYYLYARNDEYRTPTRKGLDDVNGLLYQPLNLLPSNILEKKNSPKQTGGHVAVWVEGYEIRTETNRRPYCRVDDSLFMATSSSHFPLQVLYWPELRFNHFKVHFGLKKSNDAIKELLERESEGFPLIYHPLHQRSKLQSSKHPPTHYSSSSSSMAA
ncbi:hypothetical protein LguiA_021898 [Lonicera macranthoides]